MVQSLKLYAFGLFFKMPVYMNTAYCEPHSVNFY